MKSLYTMYIKNQFKKKNTKFFKQKTLLCIMVVVVVRQFRFYHVLETTFCLNNFFIGLLYSFNNNFKIFVDASFVNDFIP